MLGGSEAPYPTALELSPVSWGSTLGFPVPISYFQDLFDVDVPARCGDEQLRYSPGTIQFPGGAEHKLAHNIVPLLQFGM